MTSATFESEFTNRRSSGHLFKKNILKKKLKINSRFLDTRLNTTDIN